MNPVPPDSRKTQQLLQQVRDGDRAAFEKMFAHFKPYLRQFVALRMNPALQPRLDPSDVVQETYLEAIGRLQKYLDEDPMPFRLWLRRLALDRLLKANRQHLGAARRSRSREFRLPEQSSLALAQQLLAPGSTPSQNLDRAEIADRLHGAIQRLPEIDREIILLRNFEGLTNAEVGYLLDLTSAAVSKRHGRALLQLHQLLLDEGLTESQL